MFRKLQATVSKVGKEYEVAVKQKREPSYFQYFTSKYDALHFCKALNLKVKENM